MKICTSSSLLPIQFSFLVPFYLGWIRDGTRISNTGCPILASEVGQCTFILKIPSIVYTIPIFLLESTNKNQSYSLKEKGKIKRDKLRHGTVQ